MWEGAFEGHLSLLLLVCYVGPHAVGLLASSFQLLAPSCNSSSMSSHPVHSTGISLVRGGPHSLQAFQREAGACAHLQPHFLDQLPYVTGPRCFWRAGCLHCCLHLQREATAGQGSFRAASFHHSPFLWALRVGRRIGISPTPSR